MKGHLYDLRRREKGAIICEGVNFESCLFHLYEKKGKMEKGEKKEI